MNARHCVIKSTGVLPVALVKCCFTIKWRTIKFPELGNEDCWHSDKEEKDRGKDKLTGVSGQRGVGAKRATEKD